MAGDRVPGIRTGARTVPGPCEGEFDVLIFYQERARWPQKPPSTRWIRSMAGPGCRPDPADSPPSIRLLPLTTPPEPDRGRAAWRPAPNARALRHAVDESDVLGGWAEHLRTGNPDD